VAKENCVVCNMVVFANATRKAYCVHCKKKHTHTHTNACMMKDVDRILLLIISGSFVFSGHSKWNLR
jgi:hypothetical protein